MSVGSESVSISRVGRTDSVGRELKCLSLDVPLQSFVDGRRAPRSSTAR